ncbi:MAG: hypothetical protein AAFW46_15180 [Pseudomonadota bacterium]
MQIHILMLGLMLAFGVFGALMFSVAQALSQYGWRGRAHLGCVVFTLALTGCLIALWEDVSVFGLPVRTAMAGFGAGLLVSAAGAAAFERGWARVYPAPLAIFGAIAASGVTLGA